MCEAKRFLISFNILRQLVIFIYFLIFGVISITAQQSGQDIMKKVDERYTGDSSKKLTTITLINKKGNTRIREVLSYDRDFGDTEKSVMVFLEPADVKGTGYLTFSYDELGKDDDSWLYLPAMRRTRRISGSKRSDYFMGTDFTYDDMGDRKVEQDTHTLNGEENIDGQQCWIIESVPIDKDYMYSRRVSWVRQDVFIPTRVMFYDRNGELLKELTVSELKKIDNIWTAGIMEMNNIQSNHRTVLTIKETEYNIDVDDKYFNVNTLERGRVR